MIKTLSNKVMSESESKPKSKSESGSEAVEMCPICRNDIQNSLKREGCGHDFCRNCIEQWYISAGHHGCPLCRDGQPQPDSEQEILNEMVAIIQMQFDIATLALQLGVIPVPTVAGPSFILTVPPRRTPTAADQRVRRSGPRPDSHPEPAAPSAPARHSWWRHPLQTFRQWRVRRS